MPSSLSTQTLFKKPGGWVPVTLSLAALSLLLVHVYLYGVDRSADEGIAAHLFQVLIVLQAVIAILFALKWIVLAPKQALAVLALQFIAAVIPVLLVYLLEM